MGGYIDHQKGWECPKCGKVWAPWMSSCDCIKNYQTETTYGTGFPLADWIEKNKKNNPNQEQL